MVRCLSRRVTWTYPWLWASHDRGDRAMGMGAWRRVIGTVGWMKPSSKSWVVTSPPLMGTGTLMGSGVDWDIGHWCCWGH